MKTIKIKFLRRPHNYQLSHFPGTEIELPADQKTAKMIARGIAEPVDEPTAAFHKMIADQQEKYKQARPQLRTLKDYTT